MTTAPNQLVAAVFDNRSLMRGLGERLYSLASAADTMGQTRLADELCDIAEAMQAAAKRVLDAHSDELDAQFNETRRGVGNILTALVSGIDIGRSQATSAGA